MRRRVAAVVAAPCPQDDVVVVEVVLVLYVRVLAVVMAGSVVAAV